MNMERLIPLPGPLGQNFKIREAGLPDALLIRDMLIEAAEWMVSNGISQWRPEQFTADEVASYFSSRRLFIAFQAEEAAGLFTLQTSDPSYWGELNVEGYYYLHRLTVRPAFRSLGLGGAMLEYARQVSIRDNMKGLRLDCRALNDKLTAYYEASGFQKVGGMIKEDVPYNLYQSV